MGPAPGGVQPGHAESQGILSLRGDLAHLGDRQGICTCVSVSSGCQQDPFLSAQGSGVSGWHLQLPLASPPKFHRRSLGSLLGSYSMLLILTVSLTQKDKTASWW